MSITDAQAIRHGALDLAAARARVDGADVTLTPLEVRFLERITREPGVVVPWDVLLRDVWEAHPNVQTRAAEALISRLRRKLGEDARAPDHIHTVHGEGIRWEPERSRPSADGLVGRDDLRARTDALLASRSVVLLGPAGVGKTALARTFRGPDVLFVPLAGARDLPGVLAALHAARGRPQDRGDAEETLAALHGWRRVVLDNAEQLGDDALGWIGRVIERLPVLLTSQRELPVDARTVRVPPLEPRDARALLVRRLADLDLTVPDDAVDRVAARLDGLPLEIEVVAPVLGWMGADEVLGASALDLPPAVDGQRDLGAALERAWALLAPDQQGLAVAVASFLGPFDVDAAARVADRPRLDVLVGLRALAQRSWLRPSERGFGMLGVIRAFVARRGWVPPGRRVWLDHLEAVSRIEGGQAVAWALPDLLDDLERAPTLERVVTLCDVLHHHGGSQTIVPALARVARGDSPLAWITRSAMTLVVGPWQAPSAVPPGRGAEPGDVATHPWVLCVRAFYDDPSLLEAAWDAVLAAPDRDRLRLLAPVASRRTGSPGVVQEVERAMRAAPEGSALQELLRVVLAGEALQAGRFDDGLRWIRPCLGDPTPAALHVAIALQACAGDVDGGLASADRLPSVSHRDRRSLSELERDLFRAVLLFGGRREGASAAVEDVRARGRTLRGPLATLVDLAGQEVGDDWPPPVSDPVLEPVRRAALDGRVEPTSRPVQAALLRWMIARRGRG